ncbi:MAG: hypothetical protein JWO31_1415 [Phycisphaerales bacterium]|nr:hypothetical protein [Phycisphaerales bacterium]
MTQPPPDPDVPTPTLDYGRPSPPVAISEDVGGLFGLIAALVALTTWGVGLYVVVYALFYAYTADRPGTLRQGGVILAIAIVCTVAAVRWLRRPVGNRGGPAGG